MSRFIDSTSMLAIGGRRLGSLASFEREWAFTCGPNDHRWAIVYLTQGQATIPSAPRGVERSGANRRPRSVPVLTPPPRLHRKRAFGREDDGLGRVWDASRILLNPPYSRVQEFVEKWARERAAGRAGETLLVLPAPMEEHLWQASWWRLVANQPACLVGERSKGERYVYPLTLISYAGERKERFANIFKNVGPIAQFI